MKVLDIVENDDGSAVINVDLTTEEARILIEKGLVTILKEMAEEETKAAKTAALLRKPDGTD